MIFSDYNQMIGKQTFNFNHKNQFNIDKILIEILSETNSGDKIYQDIEQIPKILLPKELMTRIAPCPIPEWFFKDGELAYRENDDVKMISERPTSENDDVKDRLNYFFEDIKPFSIIFNLSPVLLDSLLAVITPSLVSEFSRLNPRSWSVFEHATISSISAMPS